MKTTTLILTIATVAWLATLILLLRAELASERRMRENAERTADYWHGAYTDALVWQTMYYELKTKTENGME